MKRAKQKDNPAQNVEREEAKPMRKHWWRSLTVWCLMGTGAVAGTLWALNRETPPVIYDAEVVNVFPHDTSAYSQGLVIDNGTLYEGTGQYGESTLRKVRLETGEVLQRVKLNDKYFGEGITVWEDHVIQLTWVNGIALVYDKASLKQTGRFGYTGQGWGLTHDGRNLIMSDGTSTLRFLDPRTFEVVRRLQVRSEGRRIRDLNELEYVGDQIFANVWHQDRIACISPRTGEVAAWINLEGLLPDQDRVDAEAVLNGIAYDAQAKRLFVTGKNWPKLFEIRLKPHSESN